MKQGGEPEDLDVADLFGRGAVLVESERELVEGAVERFREMLLSGELDPDQVRGVVADLDERLLPEARDGTGYRPHDLVALYHSLDEVFYSSNETTRYVFRSVTETLKAFFPVKYVEGYSLRGKELVYEHTTIPNWLFGLALRETGVDSIVGSEIPLFNGSSIKDLIDSRIPSELHSLDELRQWLEDTIAPSSQEGVDVRERYAQLMLRMIGIRSIFLVPLVAHKKVAGILAFFLDRELPERVKTDILLLSSRIAHLITAKKREDERLSVISDGVAALEVVRAEEGMAIRDFLIRDVNPALLELFGAERSALRNSSLFSLGDEMYDAYGFLTKVFFDNVPTTFQISFRATRKTFAFVASRAEFEDLILVVRDVTRELEAEAERSRLEAKMRQTQRLESLGVLAGGIAHDFNNLLMTVLTNAELAMLEVASDSTVMESLEDIQISARLGAELTDELLAFAGESRYVVEPVDLNQVLRESLGLVKVSLSKKARLTVTLDDELPLVAADASQLRQVLVNLVTNASESLDNQPGEVVIRTGTAFCDRETLACSSLENDLPQGYYVYLAVEDTGCGMDAVTRTNVLDPFFSTKSDGRGLGLASVAGIIQGHGGTLHVKSQLMRGTTVTVLLPSYSDRPSWIPPPVGRIRNSGPPRTVLLVDDEPEILAAGRHLLERIGFSVVVARNGREAVEVFQSEHSAIDCVILDLMMPEMDGREAFHHLRQIDRNAQVVLSSGYSQKEAVRDLEQQGLAGFLQKPYQAVEFKAKLRDLFGDD